MEETRPNYTMGSEQHYIFSGSLTQAMVDYLKQIPAFEKMDVLVSQLDRSGVKTMLKYKHEDGIIKSLFIDSGAYSEHSQGIKLDVDEYIDYVNSFDDDIIAIAQCDHIPGVFQKPKKPEDYVESAELSWNNYLYMRDKLKSPDKLVAVFHQGESFEHLDRMLDWRGPNGEKLMYLGVSPSNDRAVSSKDVYIKEVYDHIAKSSNPNVKTHLFGYTSLPGLPKFPWYSCDSVSHRLRAAYNKVFTNKWGIISFSKTRSARTKADMSILDVADSDTLKELTDWAASYGFTLDQICEESSARTAADICEVQRYMREHPYKPENMKRSIKLFAIGGAK